MKTAFQNSNHLTPKKMKLKLISILTVLAILTTVTACYELEELTNMSARKKDSKVLVKEIYNGSPIKSANGTNFGPDGNLYIASFAGQEIIVMNKQNGKILKRLGPADGVISPDDLAFGPDGSLYWTDINIGEVGRMTPEGVVTKQFVAPGVNPITFSEDGRLFVGLCFLGDGLYELDPNLIAPPRQIIASTPANPFPLGFLNAFDFGPDGKLYGPLFAGGAVIRVNVGGPGTPTSTDPFGDGTAEFLAGGFTVPVAAKFDSKGVLHVLDQSGEVFKLNTLTGEKTLFIKIQEGLDNLAFDSNDALYISNADFGSVVEILPSGQPRTISRGGMIAPMGMAVLPGSNNRDALYVADLFRLYQLNGLTGREENVYKGDLLGRPGNLTTPFTLSADGENLIVSSYFGAVVQIWNPQSDQVIETYPMGIPIDAIRFKNDIAVSDLGLGGVVRASDKSMIFPIDGVNVFAPSGLATDGETLWVADWGTGIVWQVGFNGNTPTTPFPLATGLMSPEGLAWDKEGGLLVVETGASRLSRIDLATGVVSKIADGLSLSGPAVGQDAALPPTYLFDGVAVGQSGDIYVSGGGKNVIYRISKN
jgi:sugar lactone lactonase YvrE